MISVIIPTYNRKELVLRAVESVLAQSFQNFEIIVVDDGSTDGTDARMFDDARIRYERLSSNCGVSAARNRGLELARSEYITFLDSDDELLPNALERAATVLDKNASVGIVFAAEKTSTGELGGKEGPEGYFPFPELLCERGFRRYKHFFVLIRRSVVGESRFEVRNLDFLFYWRIASGTRAWFIPEPLGVYWIGTPDSMTAGRRKHSMSLSIARARVLARVLEEFGPLLKMHCPRQISFYAYGAAVGMLLAGEMGKARHFAYEAARYQRRLRYYAFFVFSLIPFSSWLLRAAFVFLGVLQSK